jgi:hypothetical protein
MTSIRSLDPVDPNAPPPDGSRVLESVLATPPPASGRPPDCFRWFRWASWSRSSSV